MVITAVPADKPPPTATPKRATPPGTKAPAKARKTVQSRSIREIERWVLKTYLMMGATLAPFKPALAEQIVASSPKCAKAWVNFAQHNDTVRKAIEKMMVSSVYGELLVANLPIALVLAAEFRPTTDTASFNQQTLMAMARMLSEDGLTGMFTEQDETPPDTPPDAAA